MLIIAPTIILISITLYLLYKPGELLQFIPRFINTKIKSKLLNKLLLCPYCFAGQLWLWSVVFHFILFGGGDQKSHLFFIKNINILCITIITVYLFVKIDSKYL